MEPYDVSPGGWQVGSVAIVWVSRPEQIPRMDLLDTRIQLGKKESLILQVWFILINGL